MKKLYYRNEYYGTIGEETNIKNIHVGDIVVFCSDVIEHINKGIVVKYKDGYSVWGWCSRCFGEDDTYYNFKFIATLFPYTCLDEYLDYYSEEELMIK